MDTPAHPVFLNAGRAGVPIPRRLEVVSKPDSDVAAFARTRVFWPASRTLASAATVLKPPLVFLLLFLFPVVMVMAVIVIVSTVVIVGMIVVMAVIVVVLLADVMVVTVFMVVRMIVIVAVVMIVVVSAIVAAVMVVIVVMLSEHGVEMFGERLFGRAIDFSNRDSAFGRDLRTGLEFWSEQRSLAVSPAELAVQLADRSLDDARLPSTLRPLHQRTADAERRRLCENDVFHLVDVRRAAEDTQQYAGAGLFHLDRRREKFDRARLEQFLFGVTDDFGRDVVEIRFELDDFVGLRQRRAFADEQPQQVGSVGEVAATGSVADRFDGHRRQGRVSCDERFQNRRTGWRGQFGLDRQIDERDAFEQLGRAGSRDWANAVSDLDASASRRHRTRNDFIDAEQVKSDRRSNDVHDRVDRADFVEMNLVERRAMHAGFGLGDVLEDFQSELLLRLGQFFGSLDQLDDVGEVPVSVLFWVFDFDLQRSEAPFDDRLDVQFDVRQAERINAAHDRFEVRSGVDQCRQSHVATDAANAVEVRNPHGEVLVVKGQSEKRQILVLA